MSKFKEQLKLIEEALLKPASNEESKRRDDIILQQAITQLENDSKIVKNEDGTYDVNGDFYIGNYDFASIQLKQLPIKFRNVTGSFSITDYYLTTLEGCPQYVGNTFDCTNNTQLTSLRGGPRKVGKTYRCNGCYQLTSFEEMNLKDNPNLTIYAYQGNITSLKGLPNTLKSLIVRENSLTNFDNCPQIITESTS